MINRFPTAIRSAWYEFLFQLTGNQEYAKVPRPEVKYPTHSPALLGMRNPANFRFEQISIQCTNPDFQRFLMGHAKECLERLSKDPLTAAGELPTYAEVIEKKCGEAVEWTLRMMPYIGTSIGPMPDIAKLKEDVVCKVLHYDQ